MTSLVRVLSMALYYNKNAAFVNFLQIDSRIFVYIFFHFCVALFSILWYYIVVKNNAMEDI